MEKLRDTKTLTVAAMLTALGIILGFFNLPISQIMEIRFGSIPICMAGMLFGPGVAGVVGGIVDIGAYFIKPTGPFFPGFTLSNIVGGIIFGLMLHGKKITFPRVFMTEVLYTIIVGVIMNSYWLSTLYLKDGYLATIAARLPKELIMIPVYSVLIFSILKAFDRVKLGAQAS
ncbi:ECF transporter S component, folate family [Pseudobutyrivibrio sp. YE44]|uniref:folate family ECF transporter S component n=1 Tax=Pseudobutyrivibrio sp. YE44 TaxID=1520802 RepID=UPI00087F055B|nr:folate family ECF transporter S component [Pseudobutyrivibrio sp. YE44]SDB12701.1 ECF transporter S component, folate family [Pseudobutyrivibrio sp. YE44]